MADQVRFLAVARVADHTLVATHACSSDTRGAARARLEEKARMVLRSGRVEEQRRLTIADAEVGSIHYDCDAACLYLVITSMDYPQRTAFRMLSELARRFEDSFGADFASARDLSLSKPASPLLSELARRYQDVATVDRVANVAVQVDQVKGVMQNNINAVLKNQDNLETLLTDSDAMRNEASVFQRSAGRAKDKMWWKNCKLVVAIAILCAMLGGVIFASVFFNRTPSPAKA